MPPSYSSRRGQAVNVSQLLQDLNRVPEPTAAPEENLRNLDDELAMFTNTNFIDWDANESQQQRQQQQQQQQQQASSSVSLDTQSTTSPTEEGPMSSDLAGFDFNLPGDFNGFDFHPYSTPNVSAFSDNLGNLQPIQPSPTFPPNGSPQNAYGASMPQTGDKRKSADPAVPPRRQLSFEEQSRLAAEEDKRRRNTAASARFRIKKKAREQALEKREKELSDKVGTLEGRIQTLETENKWLRELVMEKTGGNETLISTLLEKHIEKKPAGKESESNAKTEAEKAS
ncbi:hypothetical protein F4815DRAFT_486332 [Daldinia loculata]|uniref:uncharacterized protein n=1 Tax=Daldinia loculata TaxID=103429 RepID=UPI0020C50400|nr:uncharacterized protein F4817DRAFT_322904 [Daldinia loculata]KAI1652318.1 hypothetical protein F4817DRAFT_322904 [Daldinia loculata]KAI2775892.1 hypothetical protein F4815DRAFT_486332 [Daldinia loculata]